MACPGTRCAEQDGLELTETHLLSAAIKGVCYLTQVN